ncbi:MAG: hypothetical protein V4679_25710 [Pseudomonadota bacterium]
MHRYNCFCNPLPVTEKIHPFATLRPGFRAHKNQEIHSHKGLAAATARISARREREVLHSFPCPVDNLLRQRLAACGTPFGVRRSIPVAAGARRRGFLVNTRSIHKEYS